MLSADRIRTDAEKRYLNWLVAQIIAAQQLQVGIQTSLAGREPDDNHKAALNKLDRLARVANRIGELRSEPDLAGQHLDLLERLETELQTLQVDL